MMWAIGIGATCLLILFVVVRVVCRQSRSVRLPTDPFTIPPDERRFRAIQTLYELLEETEDPAIRQALKDRLNQLKGQGRQSQGV